MALFSPFTIIFQLFFFFFSREINFNEDQKAFSEPQVTEPKNSVLKEGQGNGLVPRLERREQWPPAVHSVGPSPRPRERSIAQAGSLRGLVQSQTEASPAPLTAHGREMAALRVSFLQRQK